MDCNMKWFGLRRRLRARIRFYSYLFLISTAPTDIYTLSLHDALPISASICVRPSSRMRDPVPAFNRGSSSRTMIRDRKSTRLNSSHQIISYAVFCLKKKNRHSEGDFTPEYERPRMSRNQDAR